MVKVIMGVPGTGKTKQLIDLVNVAINKESGNDDLLSQKGKYYQLYTNMIELS